MTSQGRFVAGLLAMLLAGPVAADVLVLKSGERREGRVEAIVGEPDHLLLISGSQQIRIPKALIEQVIEQDDATDYTILGDQFVRLQSYERAVRMYQRALESNPSHAPARAGLERARGMIGERQAETERQAQAEHAERLATARRMLADPDRVDFARVEELLNQVTQRSTSDSQKATAELLKRDLYLAWAHDREDRLDPIGAEDHLQRVLAIDKGNREAEDLLLRVWRNNPNRRTEVLKMLEDRLAESPDDLTLNQEYADLLLALNREEDAIGPLMKLHESGRFRALDYDARLERAMTRAAERRAQAGDNDGAIELYKSLATIFPDADQTALFRLEYRKRLDALEPNDWQARSMLLDNLVAQGMTRLALDEAEIILQNDPTNERALALVRKSAEEKLAEAQQAFAQGRYTLAMSLSRRFAQEHTRFGDMVQVASDIYGKASIEAERQRKRLRDQARELVTYGDENLSLARRNLELYKTSDNPNRTGVLPYRFEATKFADRALEAYREALKIDPSIAPLVGGMDVANKIRDAEDLKTEINRPARTILLPQGRSRR
ncbi:MAG: hypothetical protein KF858_03595 [Candidatus Sumerlaeia bacterium]|nr:hypothetical protein [Candidatus Sumerlaeia bacterium]